MATEDESVEDLLARLELAENQVTTSASKTIKEIDSAFDELSTVLQNAVQQRKQSLKAEVLRARDDAISSLRPCRSALNAGSQSITIPRREEVAYISANLPDKDLSAKLCAEISHLGKIWKRGPVQLIEAEENPGALLLRWEEVEPEKAADMSQFRLQRAIATGVGEPHYQDIYLGREKKCVARELVPGQNYIFRVCTRAEGEQEWSAWSLPCVAVTNQLPFCWDSGGADYDITEDRKIATKVKAEPALLFSRGPQFGPDYSIEFTVVEACDGLSDEGLGLAVKMLHGDTLIQPGALFLSAQGRIFVDGAEKTTRLPALSKGCVVNFTCERIREDRVRVHIDNDNKTVTYDWRVPTPSLYFVLCFGQIGWKILVE